MNKKEFEKLTPDEVLELINNQQAELKSAADKFDSAQKEFQKEIKAHVTTINALKDDLSERDILLLELNQKLTAAETASGKPKSLTVKVGKKTYAVKSGAHLDRAYTAQEIAENEKVAGEILKLDGQTILIEED